VILPSVAQYDGLFEVQLIALIICTWNIQTKEFQLGSLLGAQTQVPVLGFGAMHDLLSAFGCRALILQLLAVLTHHKFPHNKHSLKSL
jgi:hypothetical protein